MGYVDFKMTVWHRLHLPEGMPKEEVIRKLAEEGYTLNDFIEEDKTDRVWWETLEDTEHYMRPEENGGDSTIEFFEEDGETIWDNSAK